jgi:hypothetical protein
LREGSEEGLDDRARRLGASDAGELGEKRIHGKGRGERMISRCKKIGGS